METGSGVIEELRGDVREVVRLSRVPRGLQHRRGSGCGSGANLQNPFCAAQGGNLRGIAIQTGAGGVVAIQRVGNAMLLVEQQFQRRTLPEKRASCQAMQVSRYCASAWLHWLCGHAS